MFTRQAPQSSPNIHFTTARAEDEDYMKEEEIRHLYEWTQELSFDELVATPRLTNTRSTIRWSEKLVDKLILSICFSFCLLK